MKLNVWYRTAFRESKTVTKKCVSVVAMATMTFQNSNFHAPFLIRSWFKVFNWIKMWLASILIINTLTIAHADRGRPTLKDGERFRNGLFHDLDNCTLMCTRSNLCYRTLMCTRSNLCFKSPFAAEERIS